MYIRWIFISYLLMAALGYADTVNLVTSAAGLGANDSILWSQEGADGTTIGNTFSFFSVGGLSGGGSYAGTTGQVALACPASPACTWGPSTGIAGGDSLNWAFDGNSGSGPVTLNLSANYGVGAILQADIQPGTSYTAKLELFNGITSLGFVTENSDTNGDPLFIGARDITAPSVTKAIFSLTAINGGGDLGDFAIDTVYVNKVAASGTPEPASALLLGSALVFGLALIRRRQV